MAGSKARVRSCGDDQARQRFDRAREFLDVADLAAGDRGEDSSPIYGSAAASLAILAGIAASDAACCKVLGQQSRSENHRDAEQLLVQIEPEGKKAAGHLRELLNLKDKAQYGFLRLSEAELKKVMRRAESLIEFAAEALRR
jgi:hypothetical protein